MVYTDNCYFYAGISHLLKGFEVIWCNTRSVSSDAIAEVDPDELKIVDGMMFYSGDWKMFNASTGTDARVLWFTPYDEWNLFPPRAMTNFKINTKESVKAIRFRVLDLFNRRKMERKCLRSPVLTRNEMLIMRYVVKGTSASMISKKTGMNVKKIYRYRRNIIDKFGFKTICFFVRAYTANTLLFDLAGSRTGFSHFCQPKIDAISQDGGQ